MDETLRKLDVQGKLYSTKESFNYSAYLYRYRYKVVREHIAGPKLLEVGIGYGDFTKWLSRERNFSVVSIDGSLTNINRAKRKCDTGHVTFEHCLFEDFKSNRKFDDILITNTLEHVNDPIGILLHIKKFLKKSGRIHITVPNAMSLHRQLGKEMGMLEYEWSLNEHDIEVGHRRVYTPELLKEHVRYAGLRVTAKDGIILKSLSNSQMNDIVNTYGPQVMEGFFRLGRKYPDLSAELYLCCTHI